MECNFFISSISMVYKSEILPNTYITDKKFTVSRRTESHARINTMNISNSTSLYFNRFFTKEFFKGRKFAIDIILKALGFYRARDASTPLTIICIRP